MTAREAQLCDCPEPCGCYAEGYAAGKDKAYFEIIASLEGLQVMPHGPIQQEPMRQTPIEKGAIQQSPGPEEREKR